MKNKCKIIKHKLPLYYNPEYRGFHVVHEEKSDGTIVLGDCCNFIDDAYTCIVRNIVKKSYLKKLKRINKRKLDQYDFIEQYNLGRLSEIYKYRVTKREKDKSDYFFEDKNIISRYYLERSWNF